MIPISFTKTDNQLSSSEPQVKKKALYSQLAATYYLPPKNSKGVSQKYLEKVKEGSVFRVEIIELNKFLSDLKPNQLLKADFTCRYQAYYKIDRLLQEMSKPGLGFEPNLIPDGDWLYRVARFVDPSNVCGLFQVSLSAVPTTDQASFRIELGKRAVEHNLLICSRLDELKEVRAAIRELELSHQRFRSRKAELSHLSDYGRQLTEQVEEDKREMERNLTNTTVLVYSRGMKVSSQEAIETTDSKRQEICER